MNEGFKLGQQRARDAAAQLRAERAANSKLHYRPSSGSRMEALYSGMLLGALVISVVWMAVAHGLGWWHGPWKPIVGYEGGAPEPREIVLVSTHSGWVKGYLDEAGDFRSIEDDGLIVHGAHYWYRVPKVPN